MKRLSYEEMKAVCDSLNEIEPYQPYDTDTHWWRVGENETYAYERNSYTLDNRIIDKRTSKEVWSYYTDFYTG
jgi:hypothetical protein